MNQKNIGTYIALKRRQKNLTQEQLAESIGVSNKTISKWETGKCMPDYATLPILCNKLEITLAELLDGEDAEPNSIRLYDEGQMLDLIKTIQTRGVQNARLEAAHSVMIGMALIAVSLVLRDAYDYIAGFVVGLALVIIALGIYSAIEEKRFAVKSEADD